MVLEPDLRGVPPNAARFVIGLGATSGTGSISEAARLKADVSDVRLGVALVRGVLASPIADVLRGVALMVERLVLNEILEARKLGVLGASWPALDPGRLPCLDEGLPIPSAL